MISKKRYWGLALPICDCASCGTFDVIGGRDELEERARRRLGRVRGPHAAPAVRRRGQDRLPGCGEPVTRIADVGNPWLDAGIVPVLDAALPRGPGVLGEVVPGRLHHRELPRPVPQLVLLDARDVAPSSGARRRSRRSSATPRCSARTAGRCTRAGATRSSSTRRPSAWASTSCAGCTPRQRPEDNILFGWHAADEARRELLVLWNVYAFFVTYARLAGWEPERGIDEAVRGRRAVARARPLDPVARRRRVAEEVGRAAGRLRPASRATRAIRHVHRRPVDVVPAPLARPDARAAPSRPTGTRPSRRSTPRS